MSGVRPPTVVCPSFRCHFAYADYLMLYLCYFALEQNTLWGLTQPHRPAPELINLS